MTGIRVRAVESRRSVSLVALCLSLALLVLAGCAPGTPTSRSGSASSSRSPLADQAIRIDIIRIAREGQDLQSSEAQAFLDKNKITYGVTTLGQLEAQMPADVKRDQATDSGGPGLHSVEFTFSDGSGFAVQIAMDQ